MTNSALAVSAGKKIRVVVVDDSALVRKVMQELLNAQPDIEVVGVAPDPIAAREVIRNTNPDVITLDVEMPRMDGLEFLDRLMRLRPMPVVMVSSLTEKGSEVTLRALELGAVDFVSKPKMGLADGLKSYSDEISDKVRAASAARIRRAGPQVDVSLKEGVAIAKTPALHRVSATEKLLIIGASTGGTEAIKAVLIKLPPDCPGILIAQHMPEGFTKSFAARLNNLCRITVCEAAGGERILPGHAFIAPGHSHLLVKRSGANYVTELSQAEPVNRHRPSVDVLFRSAAQVAGQNAIGVILTGMGKDGAQGLLEMKNAGAHTVAQNEATCVVYGMPREAVTIGAAQEVMALDDIAAHVMSRLGKDRAIRV